MLHSIQRLHAGVIEEAGVFLSESGSTTYFHWSANEPNDHGGNEDCVLLWGKVMNDYPCTYKRAVTCRTSHDASAIIDVNNIPGYEASIFCPTTQSYSRNGMK